MLATTAANLTAPTPDHFAEALAQCEHALANPNPASKQQKLSAFDRALASLEPVLLKHRATAKAPGGLISKADETRPTLAREAAELRGNYDGYVNELRSLRAKLAPGANSNSELTYRECEEFLKKLQINNEAETKLLQESVNTDIGVGD